MLFNLIEDIFKRPLLKYVLSDCKGLSIIMDLTIFTAVYIIHFSANLQYKTTGLEQKFELSLSL